MEETKASISQEKERPVNVTFLQDQLRTIEENESVSIKPIENQQQFEMLETDLADKDKKISFSRHCHFCAHLKWVAARRAHTNYWTYFFPRIFFVSVHGLVVAREKFLKFRSKITRILDFFSLKWLILGTQTLRMRMPKSF